MLQQGIEWTRSLTIDLSPPILRELGLLPGLRWLADTMRQRHGLAVEIWCDDEVTMRTEMRAMIFQMVRELLLNTVKHAGATRATVTLVVDGDMLDIVVADDGRGFTPRDHADAAADGNDGFGLFSIRERLHYLGGELAIDEQAVQGARVTLRIPVPAELVGVGAQPYHR